MARFIAPSLPIRVDQAVMPTPRGRRPPPTTQGRATFHALQEQRGGIAAGEAPTGCHIRQRQGPRQTAAQKAARERNLQDRLGRDGLAAQAAFGLAGQKCSIMLPWLSAPAVHLLQDTISPFVTNLQ